VFKIISVHPKPKDAFSKSSGLKSVFEKLRFRDGLEWTVGLTVEIKLRFQISLVKCGRYLCCGIIRALICTFAALVSLFTRA